MDGAHHLEYIAADVARLREVAARNLTAPVPTCPGWTTGDLASHVANCYLTVAVPQLRLPGQAPAPDLAGLGPLDALQQAHATLVGEVAACAGRAGNDGVSTSSFWVRRMVFETVMHRIDAEMALAEPSAPIPSALAAEGIDEFLTVVLPHETRQWNHQYTSDLSDWGQRWLRVSAGQAQWRITIHPDGAAVALLHPQPTASETPSAAISGDPDPLLRWMYNRGGADQVTITGDDAMIAQFRRLLTAVMNVD
jgi:uncharacterized protein (TIGR03083 family)